MNYKNGLLATTLILTLALYGCTNYIKGVNTYKNIPDREIVFQVHAKSNDNTLYKIGMINSNGTGFGYFSFDLLEAGKLGMPVYPIQTSDANYLAFYGTEANDSFLGRGTLTVLANNNVKKYQEIFSNKISPIINSHQIIVGSSTGGTAKQSQDSLHLFDLDQGEIVETLFTGEKGEYISIGTNALYNNSLIFARNSEDEQPAIVMMDTNSGTESIIDTQSRENTKGLYYPAISPNGKWVTYSAQDGIYIVDTQNSKPVQLVKMCIACKDLSGELKLLFWPPAPSWSPDSNWIVYHRCNKIFSEDCNDIDNYDIYKANIETGEEIKLFDGGLNPYWRLSQ